MNGPPPPLLHVALLGHGGEAFAQVLANTLANWLPEAAMRLVWQPCMQAQDARAALLRWLLPWDEDGQEVQAAIDALQAQQALRQSLHALGLSYQVLRGSPEQRLGQALQSLRPWLPELGPLISQVGVTSRRPGWSCSQCSDPACEHRSFTELLARRNPTA